MDIVNSSVAMRVWSWSGAIGLWPLPQQCVWPFSKTKHFMSININLYTLVLSPPSCPGVAIVCMYSVFVAVRHSVKLTLRRHCGRVRPEPSTTLAVGLLWVRTRVATNRIVSSTRCFSFSVTISTSGHRLQSFSFFLKQLTWICCSFSLTHCRLAGYNHYQLPASMWALSSDTGNQLDNSSISFTYYIHHGYNRVSTRSSTRAANYSIVAALSTPWSSRCCTSNQQLVAAQQVMYKSVCIHE